MECKLPKSFLVWNQRGRKPEKNVKKLNKSCSENVVKHDDNQEPEYEANLDDFLS